MLKACSGFLSRGRPGRGEHFQSNVFRDARRAAREHLFSIFAIFEIVRFGVLPGDSVAVSSIGLNRAGAPPQSAPQCRRRRDARVHGARAAGRRRLAAVVGRVEARGARRDAQGVVDGDRSQRPAATVVGGLAAVVGDVGLGARWAAHRLQRRHRGLQGGLAVEGRGGPPRSHARAAAPAGRLRVQLVSRRASELTESS